MMHHFYCNIFYTLLILVYIANIECFGCNVFFLYSTTIVINLLVCGTRIDQKGTRIFNFLVEYLLHLQCLSVSFQSSSSFILHTYAKIVCETLVGHILRYILGLGVR